MIGAPLWARSAAVHTALLLILDAIAAGGLGAGAVEAAGALAVAAQQARLARGAEGTGAAAAVETRFVAVDNPVWGIAGGRLADSPVAYAALAIGRC